MKWIAILVCAAAPLLAQVQVGGGDIGGTVASTKGPEAGVWVIAETADLPTRYAKIVVTDGRGRYLLPDLPKANYRVWVRGYGLVDSAKVTAAPGKQLNLTAVTAPSARAAADYYPASYWYALLQPPAKSEFPGTGPEGNGINRAMQSQAQFIELIKTDSCYSCHALGTKATREIPAALGSFDSPAKAWMRRIQSGQAGRDMVGGITRLGADRALAMFADWTSRIAAGELPSAPARPQGIERNVVITEWDWNTPKAYLHDEIATDKRNPRVNANGLLYGAPELSTDSIPVLDPVRNIATQVKMPVRDPQTPRPGPPMQASVYWGTESIWDSQANMHNPMFDEKGRVWFTSVIRPAENPAYCKDGSIPSSKLFPLSRSGRQLAFFDPQTRQVHPDRHLLWHAPFTVRRGCQPHALDQQRRRRRRGGLAQHQNVRADARRSQIAGMDGAGARHQREWQARRLRGAGSAGGSRQGQAHLRLVLRCDRQPGGRHHLGYDSRLPGPHRAAEPRHASARDGAGGGVRTDPRREAFSPRGLDIDSNGVVWTVLSSGHFASFDRRKCKGPLNGSRATGQQCREGWSFYPFPVPQFKGVTDSGSVEASYYDWVDQHDTFGLGRNVPIATGNGEDALLALVNGKWVTLRVPYPIGFYAKGMDGRIDNPNAGWKGKGIWSTYSTRAMAHVEGGKGTTSKVLHFQLRPDPLAR